MKSLAVALALLACGTTASADDHVDVVAAPPIATAPAGGLDPDVAGRLAEAEAIAKAPQAGAAELQRAIDLAVRLFESDDPFSRAQQPAASARTVAVLGAIGARATAANAIEIAGVAYDARHAIAGTAAHDAELAQALVRWGERDAETKPAQAIYLARRARAADPASGGAVQLDEDLTVNHRRWPARVMVITGIAAFCVGLYAYSRVRSIESDLANSQHTRAEVDDMIASRHTYDVLGTALFIASPTLEVGGIVFGATGMHGYSPESPPELPALQERR